MYQRFEELLRNKNVTAYRVSKETGIPVSTFTDWKTGKSKPQVDKLKKIADYFDVTTAYLDYDCSGRWIMKIEKAKGNLTLEEIREAEREYEYDFYLLVVDAYHDPNDVQYGEQAVGDLAILYRLDVLNENL